MRVAAAGPDLAARPAAVPRAHGRTDAACFTGNAGRYADATPVFRWRHKLLFTLSRGDWTFNLTNRYLSHYTDRNTAVAPEFLNRVGHYSTWSVAATYTGNKKAELTAGIKNLFDAERPSPTSSWARIRAIPTRSASPCMRA